MNTCGAGNLTIEMEYNARVCAIGRQKRAQHGLSGKSRVDGGDHVVCDRIRLLLLHCGVPRAGERWERLPPLPERAVTIELTDYGFILATTESSNVYNCSLILRAIPMVWIKPDLIHENLRDVLRTASCSLRFSLLLIADLRQTEAASTLR